MSVRPFVTVVVFLLWADVAVAQSPPPSRAADAAPSGETTERSEPVTPLGSRIPRWNSPPMASEREAVDVMRRFASCIVRTQRTRAERLLRTLPQSTDQVAVVRELVGRPTECLSARSMRLSEILFRGAIAEVFLRETVLTGLTADPQPPGDYRAFAARLEAADVNGVDDEDRAAIVGRWLGQCVASERPDLIRDVLEVSPGSRDEQQALRAAETALSGCLLQGQVLNVHQLTMRALLAEALYARLPAGATR